MNRFKLFLSFRSLMFQGALLFSLFFLQSNVFSQTSWTGASSTAWGTAGNWTNGVPTASVDAIIGDANYTGTHAPTLSANSFCKTLTVGTNVVSILSTGSNTLTVSGDITIGVNGTITQANTTITLSGNWVNGGTYTTTNNNAQVTFNGANQSISGTAATTFMKLQINSGSITVLNSAIFIKRTLTVIGTLDPNEPTYLVSNAPAQSPSLAVNSGGILQVKASTYAGNYSGFTTTTLSAGSTVEYAATTVNQTVSAALVYPTLRISGSMTKSLTGDLPDLTSNASSEGNITVASGTLDVSSFSANRGTSTTGGTLTVSSGATLKIGGTNSAPSNFETNTFGASSTVIFNGTDQTIDGFTYGHLTLSSSGAATLAANTIVNGTTTLSSGSYDNGGFTLTAKGNVVTNVLHTGSGKILLSGGSAIHTLSGTGSFNNIELNDAFGATLSNNLILNGTMTLTAGTMSTNTRSILVSNTGSFAQTAGTISGTVNYNGTTQAISGITYDVLTISSSGTTTLTGTAIANGTVTISSGSFDNGGFTLTAKGNVVTNVVHTGTGKIYLNGGSASHTLSGTGSFNNLELNDAFGASISTGLSVNGILTLTSGLLTTSGNTLTIGPSGTVARTSGYVYGSLKMNIPTGSPSLTYHIGDASNYTPVNLVFSGVTTGGTLTANTTSGDHPHIGDSSGLSSSRSVNRYWTLTNSGIVLSSYNATFNFASADLDPTANTDSLLAKRYSGSWTALTVGTKTSTSTEVTGISGFGDFQLAQNADNPVPVTTNITPASVNVGSGAATITIYGSSFLASSVARYNGSDRTTTFVDDTTLTIDILSGDVDTAGTFSIVVFNPAPGGGISSAQVFTVNNLVPTTTDITPATKDINSQSFSLTVHGTNFVYNSVVKINGSSRTTSFVNSGEVDATILTGDMNAIGTFNITVFNPAPGGGTSNSQTFSIVAGTISGTVFTDIDGDSTKDVGEPAIASMKVYLTGTTIDSTTTDVNGDYSFGNLQTGIYFVGVTLPAGSIQTLPSTALYTVNLTLGAVVTGKHIGLFQFGSITGMNFNDKTGNGVKDTNDTALQGWVIKITGPKTDSATTDVNGNYTFINLFPGVYTVSVVSQSGWTQTFPASPSTYSDTISNGITKTGQDFGNFPGLAKYRTIKATTDIAVKTVKMKYKKFKLSKTESVTRLIAKPNLGSVIENVFRRVGKLGTTFLGVPQGKDSAKYYAWIFYKKAGDLQKLYSGVSSSNSQPFDPTIINGKVTKLSKAIVASWPKFSNAGFAQGVLFRLNIMASDDSVITDTNNYSKRFGDLVLDTSFTLLGKQLKGLKLRDIATDFDSIETYYNRFHNTDPYADATSFVNNILKPINERFYLAMDSTNYKVDSASVAAKKPNSYAVQLMGYKTASQVPIVRELPGKAAPVQFVANPGYQDVPANVSLHQNYPNPFNPATTLSFELPEASTVTLTIYDILGREVATLLNNAEFDAGEQFVDFDASRLSSGVYFYRLNVNNGEHTAMKKMMLLK